MDAKLREALAHYGEIIRKNGWHAGEKLIKKYEKDLTDFRKWAYALGITLRANEVLGDNF